MADPATIAMAVKSAVAAATDKRTWTAIGTLIAAILAPLILSVAAIICLLTGGSSNNTDVVSTIFNGRAVSGLSLEEQQYIENMESNFTQLDAAITTVDAQIQSGSIDATRVKSIFFSLYFGAKNLSFSSDAYLCFVDCFVRTEPQTGSQTASGNTSTTTVPLTDLNDIYTHVVKYIGRPMTDTEKQNAENVYSQIQAGNSLGTNSAVSCDGSVVCPVGSNWRSLITSGYGYRKNPTGSGGEFHSGLDLGVPIGTQVHAAISGTVITVKYDPDGYGNYIVIDRGDGFCTLYGHCSRIVASVGQTVKQGVLIAYSGSTGRSTGPHLHFEVDINGHSQNPEKYLQ